MRFSAYATTTIGAAKKKHNIFLFEFFSIFFFAGVRQCRRAGSGGIDNNGNISNEKSF